jgi:hypothetical protein
MPDNVTNEHVEISTQNYRDAALKALEADPAWKEPEVAPASAAPEASKAGDQTPAPEVKAEVKPEEPAEKAPDFLKTSFDKLAIEKSEIRKQREELKAVSEQAKKFESLQRAVESGDPMALLSAAGMKWSQVVDAVLGGKGPQEDPKAPVKQERPQANDELLAIKNELAAMKAERARETVINKVSQAAKADTERFKFVNHLNATGMAQGYLENYWQKTGELPIPGDLEGSIKIALEAVETNLRKQAEQFKPLLTSGTDIATVSPKVAESTPKSAVGEPESQARKTLQNNLTGPRSAPTTRPEPRTPEEYQRLAKEAWLTLPE